MYDTEMKQKFEMGFTEIITVGFLYMTSFKIFQRSFFVQRRHCNAQLKVQIGETLTVFAADVTEHNHYFLDVTSRNMGGVTPVWNIIKTISRYI